LGRPPFQHDRLFAKRPLVRRSLLGGRRAVLLALILEALLCYFFATFRVPSECRFEGAAVFLSLGQVVFVGRDHICCRDIAFAQFHNNSMVSVVDSLNRSHKFRLLFRREQARVLGSYILGNFSLNHANGTRSNFVRFAFDKIDNVGMELGFGESPLGSSHENPQAAGAAIQTLLHPSIGIG
jgi:hypothetical protein